MARIRSIKPEFFRHEALQDLEESNPGQHCMLVFAGLWTISDKNGVFEFKPRHIKLDILPFMSFDMEKTLHILYQANFFEVFEHEGRLYGYIESFSRHQRIEGTEFKNAARYPHFSDGAVMEPSWKSSGTEKEAARKQQGSVEETPWQQLGTTEKERERESKKESSRSKKPIREIDQDFLNDLAKDYPRVNLESERKLAEEWILDNPGRKFSRSFFRGWVKRAAERMPPPDPNAYHGEFLNAEEEEIEKAGEYYQRLIDAEAEQERLKKEAEENEIDA